MRISDWSSDVCSSDLFLFDPFKDGLKGMIQQFGETIRKILADAAAAQITKALFGSDSNGGSSSSNGWIGIALNAFSSYLGGARAMGGPVASRSEEHTSELQSLMRR